MTENVNYGAGVKTRHRDFTKAFDTWQKVRHAVSGDLVSYLRNVGKNEPDPEYGAQRQKEYEDGAICYNFTKRTLSGMVGAVMPRVESLGEIAVAGLHPSTVVYVCNHKSSL